MINTNVIEIRVDKKMFTSNLGVHIVSCQVYKNF